MKNSGIATVLALLLTAAEAGAQSERVVRGDRIRVVAPDFDPDTLVGTMLAFRRDTLKLRVDGHDTALALPVSSVARLELSSGQKSKARLGMAIGGVAGVTTGAVVGSAMDNDTCDDWGIFDLNSVCLTRAEGAVVGGLVGLLFGGGIGYLLGDKIRTESWSQVSIERLRVQVTPVTSRIPGIGLSLDLRI